MFALQQRQPELKATRRLTIAATGLLLASCAARRPAPAPTPAPAVSTATLSITPGIRIAGQVAIPAGFEPNPFRPPIWLAGNEIVVVGRQAGKPTATLLTGPQWQVRRAINPSVAGANFADLAAAPDGVHLAVARLDDKRTLTLSLLDARAGGDEQAVASVQNVASVESLAWPQTDAIALEVERAPDTTAPEGKPEPALYIVAPGAATPEPLPLTCTLSNLSWSPDGAYAVGAGNESARPVLIDRKNATCQALNLPSPIRVLDWSMTSFLYAAPSPGNLAVGTFRYDIGTGQSTSVAVSSQAAAYAGSGAILALGNRQLTWRRATEHSRVPVAAELALFEPGSSQMQVRSLGIGTTPRMLGDSTMTYSRASETAAIDLLALEGGAPARHIVTYSPATGRAFLLARGNPRGAALMSWSRDGSELALLDSDGKSTMLTVLVPMH